MQLPERNPLRGPSLVDAECRPEMLPAEQLQFARRLFETMLAGMAKRLSDDLYTPVSIRFAGVQQCRLAESLKESPGHTLLLDLCPKPGCACLTLGYTFLSRAVETLLGAPVAIHEASGSDLSDLDLQIVQSVVDVGVSELQKSWQPFGASFWKRPSPATHEEILEQCDDAVVVLSGEITMAKATDIVKLMVPALFVRLMAKPAAQAAGANPANGSGAGISTALEATRFTVDAVLRGTEIRMRELLTLKSGMVLQLPHKAGGPVECQINGVSKLRGALVSSGNSIAFQIESWMDGTETGGGMNPRD